jgi:hypothetical protein
MVHRCTATGALIALLVTGLRVGPAAGEIVVEIGTVEARPGAVVSVPVTLRTDGELLTGFQNDLLLEPGITPLHRDRLLAECSQNPDLLPGDLGVRSSVTQFGCGGGGGCVRTTAALSSETFPSGPTLVYACAVAVSADAASGSHAVRCAHAEGSDRDGTALPVRCSDGAVVVAGTPVERTPIATRTPTPTPASTSLDPPVLTLAPLRGHPGDRLTLEVRLRSGREPIAGLQADVGFPSVARITARPDGHPDCTYGSDPNFAGYSSVGFQPPGCALTGCLGVRLLLITSDLVPIPDGTLMLSCRVDLAPDAASGVHAFALSALDGASPDGIAVPLDGDAGSISVSGPLDAATPTPTPTSASARPTRAAGQGEQSTSAAAASGGCALAPGTASSGRWEAVAVAALLALRRRRRRSGEGT